MTEQEIRDAIAEIKMALRHRGLDKTFAELHFRPQSVVVWMYWTGHAEDARGDSAREAIDRAWAKIADIPYRWTDDQVAATLGIAA